MIDKPDTRALGRQRWRIRYARDGTVADRTRRDEAVVWAEAIGSSGLPVVTTGQPPRPHLVFGPPLVVGATAEDEPLDLVLFERLPIATVRSRLAPVRPPGYELRVLHDVWLGGRSLAAIGRAADYVIGVQGSTRDVLEQATSGLLAADRLERTRRHGKEGATFDLRPLVVDLAVVPDALLVRVRVDPERGVGRPDDVVAALAEQLETSLEISDLARVRVWLADDDPPASLADVYRAYLDHRDPPAPADLSGAAQPPGPPASAGRLELD
ncbi:MAG TPA: TIGR03936 family radical SAM-associated protein [Candidatus Limnocylindrales bacterium]|nr:TIGR03936 family radical SAM-associated protein [Candidatus Limnocylindrales bacterium]